MLTIRLQRLGKTHYATYRIVVQDSHTHPTSGKVVAFLGSFNPHTKDVQLDKETAAKFLTNGAQPTARVAKLMQAQGVALPSWVKMHSGDKKRSIRHADKLRRNQPKEEPVAEVPTEA